MSFHDDLEADLDLIFNPEEFGETHDINGRLASCIIDQDLARDRTKTADNSGWYDGIFLSVIKVFIKVNDLPRRPAQGKQLRIDDQPYTVIDCAEMNGLYEITLGMNDG